MLFRTLTGIALSFSPPGDLFREFNFFREKKAALAHMI